MLRLGLALLAAPAFAGRVHVQEGARAFAHLSDVESLAASHALEIFEQLKDDSNNKRLQEQYREAIGEIEWEEDEALLSTGMNTIQEPVMLGQQSTPGTTLSLMELLTGRLDETRFQASSRLGRLFTGRRDFAVEDYGATKYTMDGITMSLHSRMQVSFPNEAQPRFVVRRAFSYLNPVAVTIGQYIYRVLRCDQNANETYAGACGEGEVLYTITKDRLGRGALWGQDEYRVYTGTGGCRRWGHGVLSCAPELQIMYSLSEGLMSGSHDTKFYKGNINALDSGFDAGRLHNGEELDASAIEAMKVATVAKSHGAPRALNWPIWAAGVHRSIRWQDTVRHMQDFVATFSESQLAAMYAEGLTNGQRWHEVLMLATPAQERMLYGLRLSRAATVEASSALYYISWAVHLAKSLVWADSYHVTFDSNPVDELLVSVVAAVQDLTREQIALRPAAPLPAANAVAGLNLH